jgi:hypothetical protein
MLAFDAKHWPLRPIIDPKTQKLRVKDTHENQPVFKNELIKRLPFFFSDYYHGIRNKLQYGIKVKEWLIDYVQRPLQQETPDRTRLWDLVKQVAKYKPLEHDGAACWDEATEDA